MMDTAGTTRREVLKKGAVAGAIVWVAPIVSSSPAFAASGQCSGSKPCTTFYFINSTGGTNCEDSDGSCGAGFYPAIQNCAGQTVATQSGCTLPAGTKPVFTNTGGAGSITYPSGIIPLYISVKLGNDCYLLTVNDDGAGNLTLSAPSPAPLACNQVVFSLIKTASGYTFTVTIGSQSDCGAGGQGLSHMSTAFCL
jgi:hypothetical protein